MITSQRPSRTPLLTTLRLSISKVTSQGCPGPIWLSFAIDDIEERVTIRPTITPLVSANIDAGGFGSDSSLSVSLGRAVSRLGQ